MAKRKELDEDAWLRAEARALGESLKEEASARAESLGDAILEAGTPEASTAIAWREAERFFVEGEDRMGMRTGQKVVWWPSAHHVALRFKLETAEVERQAYLDKWWDKRYNYQRRGIKLAPAPEANPRALITQRVAAAPQAEDQRSSETEEGEGPPASAPEALADTGPVDPLAITEAVIRAFARAAREGAGLKSEAIAAFDKAVRLRAFLLDDGDRGGEAASQPVTLDELARRHVATRETEREVEADPMLSGVTALGDSGEGGEGEAPRAEEVDEVPTRKPKAAEASTAVFGTG